MRRRARLLPLLLAAAPARGRKNVLMIAVDDLRTELSIYTEGRHMVTPNIARLASKGVVFERTYCQVALCMPTRTSLLTSRRPDTSRSWTIEADQYWRKSGGNFTTLPQHFVQQGYLTIGMGKIFHEGPAGCGGGKCAQQDSLYSWSPESVFPDNGNGATGIYDAHGDENKMGGQGKMVHGFTDEQEPRMQDGNITDHAVAVISAYAAAAQDAGAAGTVADGRNFFLAVGLHKPHVPWHYPARFTDLYPEGSADWPALPANPTLPTAVPSVALQNWQVTSWCAQDTDLRGIGGGCGLSARYPVDNTTVPGAISTYMRRAYFASTSWTDANIGRVTAAFDAAPFGGAAAITVLWGDHGWHLGDNDQWAKMTNFEHATRIPFVISVPGVAPGRTGALVEALDIAPTILAEALGGAPPPCPARAAASRATAFCTEGRSLSALLRDPVARADPQQWAAAAYSQFPRPEHPDRRPDLGCELNASAADAARAPLPPVLLSPPFSVRDGRLRRGAAGGCPDKMGYSVRVHEYRYTAWVSFDKAAAVADWAVLWGAELYNHSASPVPTSYNMEHDNIAALPASASVVATLHSQLQAHNTGPTSSPG